MIDLIELVEKVQGKNLQEQAMYKMQRVRRLLGKRVEWDLDAYNILNRCIDLIISDYPMSFFPIRAEL